MMKIGVIENIFDFVNNSTERLHIFLLSVFIIFFTIVTLIDFITGIIASHKVGVVIMSSRIGPSIGKIISIILLYILIVITLLVPGIGFVVRVPAYYAIFLLTLREIISVIENFNKITGVRLTVGSFLSSVYKILIGRFFNKIKVDDTTGESIKSNRFSDEA